MRQFPIDHVGIVVPSISGALPTYTRLAGATASEIIEVPAMDLNLCFVGTFELLEPRSADGLLGRWLTEHGPGMHHVAYRVPDIEEAMALLEKDGMTWLDSTPRMGAQGHRIAFLHPSSTGGLLMEVVEHR